MKNKKPHRPYSRNQSIYPHWVTTNLLDQLAEKYPPRKPSILALEPMTYDDPLAALATAIQSPFMADVAAALMKTYLDKALNTTTLLLTAGELKQTPQRQYVPQPASATSYRPMFAGTWGTAA